MSEPGDAEGLSKDQFRFSLFEVSDFFVYILSNNAMVLYIGVTNDIDRRLFEHRHERDPKSFAAQYNLDRLVYCETFPTAPDAIAWEKRLKGWSREKKKKLIRATNPTWRDLSQDLLHGRLLLNPDDEALPSQPPSATAPPPPKPPN